MVLIPPTRPPSGGRTLGNHEARIRVLERSRRGSGPSRVVSGVVLDDGASVYLPGSGDWSCTSRPGSLQGTVITVTPAFDSEPVCSVSAVDPLGSTAPTTYFNGSGYAESGFLKVTVVDLSTLVIATWDLDGNDVFVNNFYFSFRAEEWPT